MSTRIRSSQHARAHGRTPHAAPSAGMRQRFVDTVSAALDHDPRLAVVLADTSLAGFRPAADRHPDRVVNVGIREQLLLGVAGGMALSGLRPVVHTYAPFLLERPFEQVKLDLGHQDVGAVLVSIGASHDAAAQGRTHMAPGDVALLDTLPGWTVHVPGHPDEAAQLVQVALRSEGRHYVRLSTHTNAAARPMDGLTVVRAGSPRARGVVLAVGPMLQRVLAATRDLDVTVAYVATVRPMDHAGLNQVVAAAGSADILIVEPYLEGTSAHEVATALADRRHRQRSLGVRRSGEVRGYGTSADHDRAHELDDSGIAAAARAFFLPE